MPDIVNEILHAMGLDPSAACANNTVLTLQLKCVDGVWELQGGENPRGKKGKCKPCGAKKKKKRK